MPTLKRIKGALRQLLASEPKLSNPHGPPVSVEAGGVTARCDRAFPPEPSFRAAWDSLHGRTAGATTFTSATWQIDGVGPTLPANTLRLITAWNGPALAAVLPLEYRPSGFIESAGLAVSDYLDPLFDDSMAEPAWRAILRLLREEWDSDLKAITLHNVRDASHARALLPRIASEEGFACENALIDSSAVLQLPPRWEEYLASLDGHERKELRRKIRKAQEQGGATLNVIDASRDLSQASLDWVTTALNLIEAADPSKKEWFGLNVRPLITRIGERLLSEGRMRLLILMCQARPAACLIEFPSSAGPLLYNSGFDPAFKHLSAGAVTFGLAIQNAIENHHQVFDMLRGQHGYKYQLGAKDQPLYRLSLHPR